MNVINYSKLQNMQRKKVPEINCDPTLHRILLYSARLLFNAHI